MVNNNSNNSNNQPSNNSNNSSAQSSQNQDAVKINDTSGDKPQALAWKPVETKSQG